MTYVQGRNLVYFVVYSLDATRCIILHLAATQSLQHATNRSDCLVCGIIVGVVAIILGQVFPFFVSLQYLDFAADRSGALYPACSAALWGSKSHSDAAYVFPLCLSARSRCVP